MKIGDLFFKARMDAAGLVGEAKRAGAKAGSAAAQSMSTPLAKEAKKGFGLGAGFAAFNVIGMAISKVTGYLTESAQAFRDDQVSVQKLTTALRSNVEGWDGSTRAIEETIASRQKLGFTDDEQRSSLAELAAAYGTVTAALDAQRVAMDLARFSGVDLATASDVLIKVHAGNYRALKALGINTKNITNETEALAAIQKVAGGQAEDFANTLEGKLVVAEVKAEEASEKFGKSIAKLQAVALPAAADAIEHLADTFETLEVAGEAFTGTTEDQTRAARDLLRTFAPWITSLGDVEVAALDAAQATTDHEKAIGGMAWAAKSGSSDVEDLADEVRTLADEAKDAEDAVDGLARTISEELFGDAINAGRMTELQNYEEELRAQRREVERGSDEYVILTGEIADNAQAQFDLGLQMANAEGGHEAVIAFLKREQARTGDATGAIRRLIAAYQDLARVQGLVHPVIRLAGLVRYGGKALPGLASGGPAEAGRAYRVGESGPETLFMGREPGYVLPDPVASGTNLAGVAGGNWSQIMDITLNVDARGATNPATVGASVRQGVHDAMADVLRQQTARLPTGTRS